MNLLLITRNSFLPLRLRKKIGNLFRPALLPEHKEFCVDIFGSNYHGLTGNHQDDKIYLYGAHEAATIRLMRCILQYQRQNGQKPIYLDVGTNSGQHLIAVSNLSVTAVGFEPWNEVYRKARVNVCANDLSHVRLLNVGLSDKDEKLSFFAPNKLNRNLGSGSFVRQAASSHPVQLDVRHADGIVLEHELEPTLIKIDTEGFEGKILTGLKQTLEKYRPCVIFELSSISREDFRSIESTKSLFPTGYTFWGIRRSVEYPKLVPFNAAHKYENVLAWPEDNLDLLYDFYLRCADAPYFKLLSTWQRKAAR